MKEGQRLWTREELILAINLYFKIPFGRIHNRNPKLIELAEILGRTPNSISYKLVNFASLDPTLKQKGADHTSKLDKEIWEEFFNDREAILFEGEKIRAQKLETSPEKLNHLNEEELPKEGIDRERLVKTRVNQNLFRLGILSGYNNKCCITEIERKEFLVAGHIRPWHSDEKNRLNFSNGLCLNSLHDRAFETGLLTITPDYKVKISSELLNSKDKAIDHYFAQYHGKEIILPSRFLPDPELLKYHNNERFKP